jgi:Ni,Fe-hydrogenase maturation factor
MGKNMKILVVGNPLVPEDSIPVRLLPDLRKAFPKFEFEEIDGVENIEDEGRDLVIIDSATTIKKVEIITDLDSIRLEKIYTMHDFDLGITLKLLKKMGKIDSVLIFAVPQKYPMKKALAELIEKLKSFESAK